MISLSRIIPLYNEEERILGVLSAIAKIKNVNEIICVDDGSKDDAVSLISKYYPSVKIIQFKKNKGESAAVNVGSKAAKNKYILLADADIKEFNTSEIKRGIDRIKMDSSIDMIVFKLDGTNFFIPFSWL